MNNRQKTVLLRFARTLGAAVIAGTVSYIPNLTGAFHLDATEQLIVTGFIIPALVSAEKWLRYGSDLGEGDTQVSPSAE